MAKLVTAAAFSLVLLIGALYSINTHLPMVPGAQTNSKAAAYFQERMDALAVEAGGGLRPIEGWTPELLMERFPRLQPSDFSDAQTFDGHLEYRNGELVFTDDSAGVATSAAESLTAQGFETLLANISTRLGLPAVTEEEIDTILAAIAPAQTPIDAARSAQIQTRIDQGASALDVKVIPRRLIEDSRCPQDVQCIWAGTVKVEADIQSGLGTATETMQLNVPITTEAEVITLIDVRPAKTSTETPLSQYEFVFKIEKRTAQ